jgi:hypothetical protein
VLSCVLQSPLVPGLQGWLYVNGVQCLWTVLLLAGTISGIRSAFVFMLVVLFPALASFVLSFSNWRNNRKFLMCYYMLFRIVTEAIVVYYCLWTVLSCLWQEGSFLIVWVLQQMVWGSELHFVCDSDLKVCNSFIVKAEKSRYGILPQKLRSWIKSERD